jgi:Alpha/beta hydrolase
MAGTATGFTVAPAELTSAGQEFTGQAQQLTTVHGQITSASVPATAFGGLPQSSQAAQKHTATMTSLGQTVNTAQQRTSTLATGLTTSAQNYNTGDEQTAAAYKSLLNGTNGASVPTTGQNAAGTTGAFGQQIADNKVLVGQALTTEQQNLASLQQKLKDAQSIGGVDDFGRPLNQGLIDDLQKQITTSQSKISLYSDIINNNRQILSFDPSGNGKISELIGTIGPNTTNVGVLVPGTFTNMADFNKYAQIGQSFVNNDPSGHLAMVVDADGNLPQSLVPGAMEAGYSQQMAPGLVDFSHQLRDQINTYAGPGNDVQVTYAGHSYGGAVVGLAESQGLDANRVLQIESAGMGHDIWNPSDLNLTQPVQQFSMRAPGDPISYIQGLQVGNLGHGADPQSWPGVTDLATGTYPNGQTISGLAAHNGVFTTGSTAWQNMYDVFTGQPPTTVQP